MSCTQSQSAFKLWALVLGRPSLSHRIASQFLPFPLDCCWSLFSLPDLASSSTLSFSSHRFFNPHSVFLFSTSSTAFGRVAPPFYCCSQLAIVVVIVICSHSRYPDFRHLISSLSLALTQRQTHPLSLLVHILLYTYNLILHCIQPNTGTYRKEKKGRRPTQKKGYPIHQSTNPHSLQPFYIPQERQQPQQQHHHLKISAFVDFDRIPQTLYPRRFWNNSFSTPNLSHLQLL